MEFRGHALAERALTLAGRYYTSVDVYALEARAIFAKRWICVGRADGLPEPGDYALREAAGESLLLVRGRDARLRAFSNVCRHRGTRLCESPGGRFAGAIRCPYHAWTYGLDGGLIGAPHMEDAPGFDRSEYPLREAAVAAWEGFLFVHLAEGPEPLAQALRPLLGRFAPWKLSERRSVRRIEYDVEANWKLLFQNFSECYHCPSVHPALARLSHYRSGANDLREGPVLGGYMLIDSPGGSLTVSGRACGIPAAGLPEEDLRRVYYYSVFPSLLLTIQPDFAMATRLIPTGVDRTRVVCDWLFSPESTALPGFDPSDGVALWDATNRQDWHMCELAQKGVSSRAYAPGPYSREESLLAAFDREYLDSLREPPAATPFES